MYMRKLFFIFTFFMKYNLFPPRDSAPFIFFLLGVPFAPPRGGSQRKKKKKGERINLLLMIFYLYLMKVLPHKKP